MKVLAATLLAVGMATAAGGALAQSSYHDGYGGYQDQDRDDYRSQDSGTIRDYARVLRVTPVIDPSYRDDAQRCYTRQDAYSDGRDDSGERGYYDRDGVYRHNGYIQNDDYYRQGGTAGTTGGRTAATVVGGVIGAVLGSQVGGGSARYATSALGTMVGGIAGQKVYENSVRSRDPRIGSVTVCDPVTGNGRAYGSSGGVSAYDVTYEYAGRQYTTRTSYNPGDRMRVIVDVRPE